MYQVKYQFIKGEILLDKQHNNHHHIVGSVFNGLFVDSGDRKLYYTDATTRVIGVINLDSENYDYHSYYIDWSNDNDTMLYQLDNPDREPQAVLVDPNRE